MSWNYLGQFTGSWSISTPPAAAVDGSGDLWVMWPEAGNEQLTYFTRPLPSAGASVAVGTTTTNWVSGGPPCLVPMQGQMAALWRGTTTQAIYFCQMPPASAMQPIQILGANTLDGPLAIYDSGGDTLFVAWRGADGDQQFYSMNVTRASTPSPVFLNAGLFAGSPGQSYFTPAVAMLENGVLAACWKGEGPPQGGDGQLYSSTAPGLTNLAWTAAPGRIEFGIPGGQEALMSINRPSLVNLNTSTTAGTVVMVFTNLVSELSYLVGQMVSGTLLWGGPSEDGGAPGLLPVDALLATAGPGGRAVSLANPVAVWAAAPGSGCPRYLLVGDQLNGTITGPLYLLSYDGE